MKKIIAVSILVMFSFKPDSSKVYICKSKGGKKYHYSENCRGLAACTHTIEKISKKEAMAQGKTLCGWED